MSDELRAVLTEALKAHQVYQCSRSSWDDESIQWWQCHGCDFKSNTFPIKGINWVVLGEEIAANHQADVIASLPGVAVIQLPEVDRGWATRNAWTVDESYVVAETDVGVVLEGDDTVTALRVETATRLAAALLAAAAAVVAEGNLTRREGNKPGRL
ncbi:hypothetical protein ALICE_15 [Mycobacterium phage Alice]|uniref:Uncharacterized protein n=1 Tax=Mycobacterium phage Alice TaxID=1034128 RepID=G1BKB7_9CAUD|nr:hypothetical protein ALICE_15 [Mycobacterium phage Alice]AEJ94279.1 hypothetical protein ALICE_15 [Mycobacterium phage Alice]